MSSEAEKLRTQSCAGMCGKDTPKLPESEVRNKMEALPLWRLSEDGKMISRKFVARNFTAALKFFNDVGEIAEREGHHPDLHLTNYREVRVDLSTHSIDGLALPDFILAAKLDAVEVDYSPKWKRENLPEDPEAGGSSAYAPPFRTPRFSFRPSSKGRAAKKKSRPTPVTPAVR
eukprot:CAMPEP_0177613070 /NCGR_PEP_ID=MMETSP0419_2-20121207/21708_1 /TAXON_ID=582737 /ORGANISM="Tetraselmis sp., Strain GSL018" /LENGTH=173 /DNA_ID=CAMNT_0019109601 /DNA_START=285 /DNA_END=804 /DNA_ORIENTATION=+